VHRRRSILFVFLGPPLCGLLAAALVSAAWLVADRPELAAGKTWLKVEGTGEVHYSGSPTQPVFFLAVGNDGRTGETVVRGDALHLIGVNPAQGSATILDFPRDLGVPLPGHGNDKITHALAYGGLKLMAPVVSQLVGVDIPYAVTTNFDGFIAMVDEVGGIDINIPTPMHDSYSGAYFDPGPHHLTGDEALRFSRDRHDFPLDDIKRTENQGLLIISALDTLRRQNPGAAGTLRFLATVGRHVELQGAGLSDLYRLGRLALSIDPTKIRNVVVPTLDVKGTTVLGLDPAARGLFADFADDAVLETH
jgi:polyisoprenyl-teichoic acid--peptidoglycan teichoic acid transferase